MSIPMPHSQEHFCVCDVEFNTATHLQEADCIPIYPFHRLSQQSENKSESLHSALGDSDASEKQSKCWHLEVLSVPVGSSRLSLRKQILSGGMTEINEPKSYVILRKIDIFVN